MDEAQGFERLFSFLLFGGIFYLMMRFGCGAHMIHGHGHHAVRSVAKDPVCGMEVQADRGYRKMHQGCEYRFCSRSCLLKFDDDPQRYLAQEEDS